MTSSSPAIPPREDVASSFPWTSVMRRGTLSVRLPASLAVLAALLLAQAAVFASAVASGKIPPAVLTLFRALLTL